ncbi:MAG: acetyl-CoA carboxylase biotin carboxyl carrier protein [Candidatus Omnitrophica bacterium]|nr:acetyl-CoA carboxylase biotin carboxyl carrier protein [Candidatus Omnitrophota bacterium]MBU3933937.1 acetyl-CoA carboxylase biotin carboxyl carrier protein [Candidatus Omnitrophota bacterium]MBU4141239.1 acetyl-CoA carboxylase biotin carboxyl carrier protein [Candidatus Omnitrophota bacterium]
MNLKEIKEMINLMNENDLLELELERDGLKVRLKKSSGQLQQIITTSEAPAIKPQALKEEPVFKKQELIEIKSPMVGTFYRTSSPESAPFVDTGSEIQPGEVICIIEAMKLMNEIKAEVKGRIKEILVENGNPVEFGQVLFRVEPLL